MEAVSMMWCCISVLLFATLAFLVTLFRIRNRSEISLANCKLHLRFENEIKNQLSKATADIRPFNHGSQITGLLVGRRETTLPFPLCALVIDV